MKITLEIPKKENRKEIEKVYEAEVFELPFEIIDGVLEALGGDGDNKEQVGWAILKAASKVKPILIDIFDGLTEEELKRVDVFKGIVPVLFAIFNVAKEQLTAEIKNVMKGHRK